jgi:hypothetical protein
MTSAHRVTPPSAVLPWLFLVCIPVLAHAAPAQETWMSVLLDGHKIGSMHTTRTVEGDRVITTPAPAGRVRAHRDEDFTDGSRRPTRKTLDGAPLKFDSRTKASGVENFTRGEIRDGHRLEVHSRIGGANQTRTLEWPHGSLLGRRPASCRIARRSCPRHALLESRLSRPTISNPIAIDSIVGESASVDLPDGARMLTRIEQTIRPAGRAGQIRRLGRPGPDCRQARSCRSWATN